MFILLPLAEGEIPQTAGKRVEIIQAIYRRARAFGFTKEDLLIDGMVMTAASNPKAPAETLKTIEWVSKTFKGAPLIGLSNVSFGMPERRWLNAAFLAMATARGLRPPLPTPRGKNSWPSKWRPMSSVRGTGTRRIISPVFSGLSGQKEPKGPTAEPSPPERVYQAILDGNREDISDLVNAAMAGGKSGPGTGARTP